MAAERGSSWGHTSMLLGRATSVGNKRLNLNSYLPGSSRPSLVSVCSSLKSGAYPLTGAAELGASGWSEVVLGLLKTRTKPCRATTRWVMRMGFVMTSTTAPCTWSPAE